MIQKKQQAQDSKDKIKSIINKIDKRKMRIDKEILSKKIEEELNDLGKLGSPFCGTTIHTNIVDLQNGKKAQLRIEIIVDNGEFDNGEFDKPSKCFNKIDF